ncbi:GIY-YIG nuclease family protein [uncultured Pseudodesulfovibrio sp.]|uniref:GIY-YIG nuclease family protein n=1 Tax=uncultured Pseudodesulfovibrio sp. TaxID=2035858 RepID=UPI0029C819DF|nr:GIY-YIG nuclease family protein [uncultured Pseudodesulfovibrio sp.]
MQHWYVYLLRCADDSLYCGITTDINRRLKEHNAGTASKYTRPRRPVALAACGEVADKSTALKLEIEIKKQHRNHKIAHLKTFTDALQE